MRADIDATLQTNFSAGGQIYWLIIIYPNTGDSWQAIAVGNLAAYSLVGYTVWAARIVEIGQIDMALEDPLETPLAKINDSDFTIQNIDGTIDPSLYIGRKVEIRAGYGPTMSIATSTVIATMKISGSAPDGMKQVFKLAGLNKLQDKEIGRKPPSDVGEKERGKIYPIVYGDQTDEYAGSIAFKNRVSTGIPELLFDTVQCKALTGLYCWDDKSKTFFRMDSSQYLIKFWQNGITLASATGTTVANTFYPYDGFFMVDDGDLITYNDAEETVLQLGDEMMRMTGKTGNRIYVERAYHQNHDLAVCHAVGELVYQIKADATKATMRCNHIFMASALGNVRQSYLQNFNPPAMGFKTSQSYAELSRYDKVNNGGYIWYEVTQTNSYPDSNGFLYAKFRLIFPETGISGTVVKQYLIAKAYNYVKIISSNLASINCFTAININGGDESSFCLAETNDATPVDKTFDNIGGSDLETAIDMSHMPTGYGVSPVYVNMALTDVSGLGGSVYDVMFVAYSPTYLLPEHQHVYGFYKSMLYSIGFRIDFDIDIKQYDVYARMKGRVNPGGYFNGAAGDLMENPSSVIEDFCRTCIPGMTYANLDETSFDAVYAARSTWKLATTFYAKNDIPKSRDCLKALLANSGLIAFERYNGTLALATLDAGASIKTIADVDVQLDSNKMIDCDYSFTDADKLITAIDVKYQQIVPADDQYGADTYLRQNTTGGWEHNFTLSDSNGGYGYYLGLLESAKAQLDEDRPLTLNANAIRDADTAERLARINILLQYKPMAEITLTGTYSLMALELGDKVDTNISLLPSALNSKIYMVSGMRIKPNVGSKPGIRVKLLELGSANLAAAEVWQDTFASGAIKTDKLATGSGNNYQGVM